MKTEVLIVGAGAIGKAIAKLLRSNREVHTEFWDVMPEAVKNMKPLEILVPQAQVIFLCIPTCSIVDAAKLIRPHLKRGTIIVSVSKGLCDSTSLTADEILVKKFPGHTGSALFSGPMLSKEIMAGQHSSAIIAAKGAQTQKALYKLFRKSNITLAESSDMRGIALAGVLKNIYAIGLGMAQALKLGHNFRGWYAVQALFEAENIIAALNGNPKSMRTLAGVGDFVATGLSPTSRNQKLGRDMVLYGKYNYASEGYLALPVLKKRLGKQFSKFPLLVAIDRGVKSKKHANNVFKSFL